MDWLANLFNFLREHFAQLIISVVIAVVIVPFFATVRKWLVLRIVPPRELKKYLFKRYLRKADTEPEVFRITGRPEYVDFKDGFVYCRPEASEIIQRLKQDKLIGVKGLPASGKTYLIFSVGYLLLNASRLNPLKRRLLYYVPLKEQAPDQNEIKAICGLPSRATVIIDDCHFNSQFVERLFTPEEPRCHIVLFSRSAESPTKQTMPGAGIPAPVDSLFDRVLKGNPVIAIDDQTRRVAEKIVGLYETKKKIAIQPATRKLILDKYGNDLMLLGFALKAYQSDGSLTADNVEARVTLYFASNWLLPECFSSAGFYQTLDDKDRMRIRPAEAGTIFLILASAYRYEISLPRTFLKKRFAVNEDHLDVLLRSRTVTSTDLSVGLPHSGLANMIVQAVRANESVRSLVKELPEDVGSTFPDGVLYAYLENYPEQIVRAMEATYYKAPLMLFMLDSEALHSLRTLLPLVRRHGDIFRSEFSKVTDLIRLKSLLLYIYIADNAVCREILDSCGDILADRVTESSLGSALTDYIVTVSRICDNLPRPLLVAIQHKIETNDVGEDIGPFIGGIASDQRDIGAQREIAAKTRTPIPQLPDESVSGEMYDAVWQSIKKMSPNFIAYLSSNRNLNVAKEIIPTFINKLKAEPDYENIAVCLAFVAARNPELAVWLCVTTCDPTHKDFNKVPRAISNKNPRARERFEWFMEAEKNNPGRRTIYDFEQQKMIFS